MNFHVMTLFPEMIENGLGESIIGRAAKAGYISYRAVNMRDYTVEKHGKVDDYPYGGGAGMLIQPQPVYDCYQDITKDMKTKPRTIYLTPQGKRFDQKMAKEFAKEEELVFLCGHYEGIDERVLEEIVTDYVSIGDYVLTGGELPVMVMIDAIARLVPGVLNNETSAETESFHNDLLEYPQYTRPPVWREKEVPQVLLSGNHQNIVKWRLEQSVKRTEVRRPDLYAKYQKKQSIVKRLSKKKRLYIHMMELLSRGLGEVLYERGMDIVLFEPESELYMVCAESLESAKYLVDKYLNSAGLVLTTSEVVVQALEEKKGMHICHKVWQYVYTLKEPLPVKHKDIRRLTMEHFAYVTEHYDMDDEEYVRNRIEKGQMFGAFVEDRLVGFVGVHAEGSCGLLYVDESCRGMGIGQSLENYIINYVKSLGFTPYGQVKEGNVASIKLQEKNGLYMAEEPLYWVGYE
ncbi:MAG: tRNA (guanosine(37)-N1)-methyltransferase TrmD [Lachnospiraceae bacterium]|nr:tRNA (guanosine(37)-N1)-methyltransferase TrmD [Lachnospiraceae bacterium]